MFYNSWRLLTIRGNTSWITQKTTRCWRPWTKVREESFSVRRSLNVRLLKTGLFIGVLITFDVISSREMEKIQRAEKKPDRRSSDHSLCRRHQGGRDLSEPRTDRRPLYALITARVCIHTLMSAKHVALRRPHVVAVSLSRYLSCEVFTCIVFFCGSCDCPSTVMLKKQLMSSFTRF